MKRFIKTPITCLFLLVFAQFAAGQRADIDSLESALKLLPTANATQADTTRINLLNNLAQLYLRVNPDRANELSEDALDLAVQISFEKGMSDAFNNLGSFNRARGNYPKALEYHEKALALDEKTRNLGMQAITLKNIGNVYLVQGQYEKSLEYYFRSKDLLKEAGDEYALAAIHNNIGLAYKNQGNYNEALKEYEKSFEIFKRINNQKGLASSYNNFGIIYLKRGDYESAIDNYLKSLEIVESIGDKVTQHSTLNNLGNIYFQQENFLKALEFYEKSLQIKRELGDKSGIASTLSNIGGVYKLQGNYVKALEITMEALKTQEEIGDKSGIITSMNNIGSYYYSQGNFDKSLEYMLKSLKLQEESGQTDLLSSTLVDVGDQYRMKKQPEQALVYYEKALGLAKEKMGVLEMKRCYEGMAHSYSMLDDAKMAYDYSNKLIKLKDSLGKEQNQKMVAEMQAKFETERKQKENQLLIAKARQRTFLLYGISAFAAIIVLLAVMIFVRYRSNRKLSMILERKNHSINQQKEKITSSITYAKRIQEAILPRVDNIQNTFPDSFIYFKPKEIVSGDFYWFARKGSEAFIAAVDCTGHGVPGAFMSMIGNDLLNQIINVQNINQPSEVLNNLHIDVQMALKQEEGTGNHDGMDIALCKVDLEANELEFASANRVLYFFKDKRDDMMEIRGDMHSIGGLISPGERSYTSHKLKLDKGDTFYMFSDGLTDQFGGPDGKKFGPKNLKAFIYNNVDKPMKEQGELLKQKAEEWVNGYEQVDDILVLGVRY